MTPARRVFKQNQATGGKLAHLSITNLHFERPRQLKVELALGCGMPGAGPCKRNLAKNEPLGSYGCSQIQRWSRRGEINRRYGYRHVLKVRFASSVAVHACVVHVVPSRSRPFVAASGSAV